MEFILIAASIAIALVVRAIRKGEHEKPVRIEIPVDEQRKLRR